MYLLLLLSEEMLDAEARQEGGGLLLAAMGAIESGTGRCGGVGRICGRRDVHRPVHTCT